MSSLKEPFIQSARSADSRGGEANRLHVLIKSFTNLPSVFSTFGTDSKGVVSTNPADHVFAYSLQCTLVDNGSVDDDSGRAESSNTRPQQILYTNGKYRTLDSDDLHVLNRGLQYIETGIAEELVPPSRPTTASHQQSIAVASPRDCFPESLALTSAEAEKLMSELSINFLWTGLTRKEQKEEADRLAAEKAAAKAKEKPGKKKTPKELEEEERKRREEEEKAAGTSAGDSPGERPGNFTSVPLNAETLSQLMDAAENKKPLLFRFRRCLKPGLPADTVDVNEMRYRGTLKLLLDPFLEPGRTCHQYTLTMEPEMTEPMADTTQGVKSKAKGAKNVKKKGDLPSTVTTEEEGTGIHPYLEVQPQMVICFRFAKPLVYLPEHRPRPDFRPTDIIPRRIKPLKRPIDGARAYAIELKSIVLSLVDEWRRQGGVIEGDREAAKSKFLAALQEKGLATSYKEKLKHCIIKVVKEKFSVKSDTPQDAMMVFYNELYVYLLDLMHRTINEMFARSNLTVEPFEAEESKPKSKWKRLAEEAEESGEFALAAKYHQERLVHESDDPDAELQEAWCDYGEFALRMRDTAKAEQNFKEALAIDINHLRSLVAYGMLLLNKKLFLEAEVFLQAAVDVDVNDALPWACLGLFMELAGKNENDAFRRKAREKEASYSFNQAKRLLEARGLENPGVNQFLAEHLLDLRFDQLADHCLTVEVQRTGQASVSCLLLLGRLYFQSGNYDKATTTLQQVLENQKDNITACLTLADSYRAQSFMAEAEKMYYRAVDAQGIGVPGKVYVRLGLVQLALKKYEHARDSYLWAAKAWPCGLTWLGVGIAYYRSKDYSHAEQALNEANILNNLNPIVWAYLCLVCLKMNRPEEADFAFNQSLKQSLEDAYLLAEIGTEQLTLGRIQFAEGAFRKSLKVEDRASTHLLLANTLTQMRLFEEAKAEYATVIAMSDDPQDQEEALKHMRTIDTILP